MRYIRNPKGASPEILATQTINLSNISAVLDDPDDIGAGSEVNLSWDGPNYKNDYLSIAMQGDADRNYSTYAYTERGNPAKFTALLDPGI